MGDLLNSIIDFIVAGSLATAKDTDIFKDYSPSTPDSCVCVYEYNGSDPAIYTDMSVRSIQITARAKSSAEAKAKCWDVFKLLYQNNPYITLGSRICILGMRNTPIKIAVDELNRTIWAFNMAITTNFD